jgi:hypothetical protein
MEKPNALKESLFSACCATLEKTGWKGFSFAKASEESGLPLSLFYDHFSSLSDIMIYLFKKLDREVLESINISEVDNPKDILFDVLMIRFEAAQPYKLVLKSFWKDWIFTADQAPPLLLQGFSSMAWMLEAAHIDTQGIKGFLRIQGLTTLYLLTLRTWLSDETPELGKTMAFLDKGLSRLEKMAGFLNTFEI